jgi:hypothetical protein
MLMVGSGVSGCDPQVTPQYLGEALALIRGTVINARTDVPPPAEVALVWATTGGDARRPWELASTAAVANELPSRFTVGVYEPPPENALMSQEVDHPDTLRYGQANIIVVTRGATDDPEKLRPENVLGLCDHATLVYFEEGAPPGSAVASSFGGTFAAGYYVFAMHLPTEDEIVAFDTCMQEELAKTQAQQECASTCSWDLEDTCNTQCSDQYPAGDLSACPTPDFSIHAAEQGLDTEIVVTLTADPRVDALWLFQELAAQYSGSDGLPPQEPPPPPPLP